MRKVKVADYDPAWPEMFETERELLYEALGNVVVSIQHIGSTAVPGLAAKPIIDILLEVTDLEAIDAFNDEMEEIGYEARGEYGIPGRRYFRKGGQDRTHHIHAFACGASNVIRHVAFRDYLRAHPETAHEYGELKKQLAGTCNNDIDLYCEGKDAYVKRIEAVALESIKGRSEGRS